MSSEAAAERFPTPSRRGKPLRVAAIALVLFATAVGGFFGVRWAMGGGGHPQGGGSSVNDGSIGRFASFKNAVLGSRAVIVAQITGDPVERPYTSGSVTVLQEDYSATIQQYLKGKGATAITFTEPKQYTSVFPNGDRVTSPAEIYGRLQNGHRYVLFLAKTLNGPWVLGVPVGFEIMSSGALQAIDEGSFTTSPKPWGLSTIDDLKQQVASIIASSSGATPPSP